MCETVDRMFTPSFVQVHVQFTNVVGVATTMQTLLTCQVHRGRAL
jgi:hypothetical protein